MGTRNLRWRYPWVRGIALCSWALLVIPATDARAVTFGEWATSKGLPLGQVMWTIVDASGANIDSLGGIGDYDWDTTPTYWLILGGNQISTIEAGDFIGLDNLSVLSLDANQITSLEPGDFAGLDDLEQLGLSGIQIRSIDSDDFTGLTNLTALDLRNNPIVTLESGAFSGLTNLTRLDLRDSQIATLEPGAFAGLDSLMSLDLDGNSVTSVGPGAFGELGNLRELLLQRNQITSIESTDFTGLTDLMGLDLRRNQIASIESRCFNGLCQLVYLFLDYNQITSIESAAFAGLGNLEALRLGQNPGLTDLPLEEADFSALISFDVTLDTSIARVSLRNTVLTQMALATFVGGGSSSSNTGIGELPGITELDLSGVDFSAITDLSPLYLMDSLTDLWLVDVENLDANALDALLDNLATMENPDIEGALYLTEADFDAFNTAGDGKLAAWDAETGHHVEIIGLGDANADGVVDDKDASVLGAHWLQTGNWLDGDFNGDHNVNDADAAILAAHWGEGVGEESVPEPGSLALLAGIAVMAMIYLRRRKA